jgi:hypothetical protein
MINTQTSDLAGVPVETLQQWLLACQTALFQLASGGKVVQVSYMQGDGQKLVSYQHSDMATLRGFIQDLKAQLGIGCGRSPISPIFTSGSGYGGRRGRW